MATLYHVSFAKSKEEVETAFREGADAKISAGNGQGHGFYLFKDPKHAIAHAEDDYFARGRGQPLILQIDREVTPQEFDIDYEANARLATDFFRNNLRFLQENAQALRITVNPGCETITVIRDKGSRGSFSYKPAADDDTSIAGGEKCATVMARVKALRPELYQTFLAQALPHANAIKYVGSEKLPVKISTLDEFRSEIEPGIDGM